MEAAVTGRYELLQSIATGGMAEVFAARWHGDAGVTRDVAIKRMLPHLARHESAVAMFQREARILASLTHPHIPQLLDVGCVQGIWYMVLERVRGPTLRTLWDQAKVHCGTLPLGVALGVVMQVCEALSHAHGLRDEDDHPTAVIHRDVNPHNIMVTPHGIAKLMDFGAAFQLGLEQHPPQAKGTYAYMAPEQVEGRTIDARADVFSVGVVLHELVTGARLYRGSEMQVMQSIVEHDAPPPSAVRGDCPPDLDRIVQWTLQRDPNVRCPSTEQLASELEGFVIQEGVRVAPHRIAQTLATIGTGAGNS